MHLLVCNGSGFDQGRSNCRNRSGVRVRNCLALLFSTVAAALALCAAATASVDPWRQIVGNGFGDVNNRGVRALHVFNGMAYAATERRPGSGAAQLWRSTGGQRGSWNRVTDFQPPLAPSAAAITAMTSTSVDGGLFFLGTKDPGGTTASPGPVLYRSIDGSSWILIDGQGTGWVRGNNVAISSLVVFAGKLYVATENGRGAQLWRTPPDGSAFEKVLDFATINRKLDAITSLAPFGGRLYAGTRSRGKKGGQLWVSATGDRGSWRKVTGADNGFGRPQNKTAGSAMVDFEGKLYASTHNPAFGGELWSSADGAKWKLDMPNGVDEPTNRELPSLDVAFGQLWITTRGVSPGSARVYRADRAEDFGIPDAGIAFRQSSEDGFGSRENRGGRPVTVDFGNSVFWGGENRVTGAQVWQLDMDELKRAESTGPGVEISTEPVRLTPRGFIPVKLLCPVSDPGGCHGDLVLRTIRRFIVRGKRTRLALGSAIFEMDQGQTADIHVPVPRRRVRLIQRLGKLKVRAHSVALDNAEDTVAEFVLQA